MNGIWVRSQDKRVLRCCDDINYILRNDRHEIQDITSIFESGKSAGVLLGTYPTEQRALEVLDDIHGKFNLCVAGDGLPFVYQMPEA